jgi:ribonuclease HII
MTDLAKQYPAYGWDKNAGYGTKIHQQALQQFGITPHHRLSYKPIQKLINP